MNNSCASLLMPNSWILFLLLFKAVCCYFRNLIIIQLAFLLKVAVRLFFFIQGRGSLYCFCSCSLLLNNNRKVFMEQLVRSV